MIRTVFVASLCLAFLSCGCCPLDRSLPVKGSKVLVSGEGEIWHLQLIRNNALNYAGLLAIKRLDDGVQLVMLDSTGIKIFEAVINKDGMQEKFSLELVRKQGLPGYLGTAVKRIFIDDFPDGCELRGLTVACTGEDRQGNAVMKKVWFGPFPIRQVVYFFSTDNPERFFRIKYSPLIGPDLILKRM